MIHLAGIDITVEGRYVRQRCSWCGEILVDEDLTLCMVPAGQEMPKRAWEVGAWIRVEGKNPTVYSVVKPPGEEKFPPGSCLVDVCPPVALVKT